MSSSGAEGAIFLPLLGGSFSRHGVALHQQGVLYGPLLEPAGQGGHRGAAGVHQVRGRVGDAARPAAAVLSGTGRHRNATLSRGVPHADGGTRAAAMRLRGTRVQLGDARGLQALERAARTELQTQERVPRTGGAVLQ